MTLTIEWRRRVENWRNALSQMLYRPLGKINFEGFTTLEQLSSQEALARTFCAMPVGSKWGAKWEYGWFKGDFSLPQQVDGKRVVLRLDLGGDSLVWVNSRIVGSKDWAHKEITITTKGVPGTKFNILAEAYSGHGKITVGGEPIPYGVESVPEPGPTQVAIGESTFGVWEEELYQLMMDVNVLFGIREKFDPYSLRVAEIDKGLQEVTLIVDLEAPPDELSGMVMSGRKRLKPLLDCVNGSTMPVLYAIGHAHLDVAWLWPLQETERKMGRTIANQLALMDEYPEYVFLQSQAHLYTMLKDRYPDLYEQLLLKIKTGQLVPEGGSWVEPDTNLTGGESLIRQFIHGKQFFKEQFGIDCELFWEPDVFGYSGALPQIMRGCGLKYFATQKLNWTYNGADPFPYNVFIWEGIDGSEVLAHVFLGYGNETSPGQLIENWKNRNQKMDLDSLLFGFGWGDGGGGPTRDHLEYLKRERDIEGAPRVVCDSPVAFFKHLDEKGKNKNRYVGELYYACHRGTYTSQARTKRNNRKCEIALREAEFWSSAANILAGIPSPKTILDDVWKTVLLNQFHDILPGSSIARVYDEAEKQLGSVLQTTQDVAREAAKALVGSSSGLTVFNSLSWERKAQIFLPPGKVNAYDKDGIILPKQTVGDKTIVQCSIPACGWKSIRFIHAEKPPEQCDKDGVSVWKKGNLIRIENESLQVTFDEVGEMTNLVDKTNNRELLSGRGNQFKMYKDIPTWFDAWDIDSMVKDSPVDLGRIGNIQVVESGPLVGILRVERLLGNSPLVQEIMLQKDSRRIDFITSIDWQERHKLLKVAFSVDIHANDAVHEIQFGHIRRPNHFSRPHDADRFEVSNHKWSALVEENRGAAVLNDCKYGLNVIGNTINLTLLKSAMAPDMKADQGVQEFTYALYTWNGCIAESDLLRESYDLNVPPMVVDGITEDRSLLEISAKNVILETVKMAEDGSKDMVIRLFEAMRSATQCHLLFNIPVSSVTQTNMLEEGEIKLDLQNGCVALEFRPFEIKTLRCKWRG
jgi:alpha-mannosidase